MLSGDPGGVETGTLPRLPSPVWVRLDQVLRAVAVGVLVVLVASAAVGRLGIRTATTEESSDGFTVSVEHARIARGGLAAPFTVTVTSSDGRPLPASVAVAVSNDYLAMFDENGFDPAPASESRDDVEVVWTFDLPEGARTHELDLDARIEPAVQWKHAGTVALVIGGRRAVDVPVVTWVLP